jgi:DNA-directed RNA polymerase specialized sigma subunit
MQTSRHFSDDNITMATFRDIFLSADDVNALSKSTPKSFLESQYEPAYTAWKKNQSDTNREALLRAVSPIIASNVNLVGNADKNYLTIQGKILAMKAMQNYDPSVASLSTYLSGQLYPLRRYARQQMNVLGVPERIMMATQQLEGAEVELEGILGRVPTTDELADHMKMSAKQIERIRKASHARNTGRYDTPDEEGNTQSPAVRRTLPEKYLHDYVLSALENDPVSQFIYENDVGLNGRSTLSNNDLASKLRISASAVSQRRTKILRIINKAQDRIYG